MGDKAYKLTVPQLKKLCDFFEIDRYVPIENTLDHRCKRTDSFLISYHLSDSLSSLCTRQGKQDKDGLVDTLLDFLGSPDEKLLKGYKKEKKDEKKTTGTKKAAPKSKSKKEKGSEEEDDEKDYEVIERGTVPNEKQLRQWVVAYVRCFNMEKCNIKHALEVAGDKFGVDLADKKKMLKKLLTEEM
jgi:hypothetical protein